MSDLLLSSSLHGRQVDVAFSWRRGSQRPGLKLLRRRQACPATTSEGLTLVDLDRLFSSPQQPWVRIERNRYLLTNSVAEGGLCQAEVAIYYDATEKPVVAEVSMYGLASSSMTTTTLTDILELRRSTQVEIGGGRIQTLSFLQRGSGALSTLRVYTRTSSKFIVWEPARQSSVALYFDTEDALVSTSTVVARPESPDRQQLVFTTTRGTQVPQVLTVEELYDSDADQWDLVLGLEDREPSVYGATGLEPETWYGYSVFVKEDDEGDFITRPEWQQVVQATGDYGLGDRLYGLLPAIHRTLDEPTPEQKGQGQLRRFTQVFGAALDQVRSQGEGLTYRHELPRAGPEQLKALAQQLGWQASPTLSPLELRTELSLATESHAMAGTIRSLRSLVAAETGGWKCEVRELMHRVLVTNGSPPPSDWNIWFARRSTSGTDFTSAMPYSNPSTPGFEGRPAPVRNSLGERVVFRHSRRRERRELYGEASPLNMVFPDGFPTIPDSSDVDPAAVLDPNTGLWVFWSSNSSGKWDIWGVKFSQDYWPNPYGWFGPRMRLTHHATALDQSPAAVLAPDNRLWLFWQSNRNGTTDIWAQTLEQGQWQPARRITTGVPVDQTPKASVDGSGNVWLFWCRDMGRRSRIYASMLTGGGNNSWSEAVDVSSPNPLYAHADYRDECPAAVWWNNALWLFWHSNRNSPWKLWYRTFTFRTGWSAPTALRVEQNDTLREMYESKEPALLVSSTGELELFWRSQWNGGKSRPGTVDTQDSAALSLRGWRDDSLSYTYNAGTANTDRHGAGAVGIYLTPTSNDTDANKLILERLKTTAERLRPLAARFFWFLPPHAP